MEIKAVREIVNENIRDMKFALWLQSWEITCFYDAPPGEWPGPKSAAYVEMNPKYRRATITFVAPNLHDEATVLNAMRHELLHLVLEDEVFEAFELFGTKMSRDEGATLWDVYRSAVERRVRHLESLLDDHGATPQGLIDRCRKKAREWAASGTKSKRKRSR